MRKMTGEIVSQNETPASDILCFSLIKVSAKTTNVRAGEAAQASLYSLGKGRDYEQR